VKSHDSRIPFNDPKRKFSQDENLASSVAHLIANGPYFHGNEEIAFEESLASLVNVSNSVFVSSGTSALYLAVASLELPLGSEVIMAANAGGYASVAVTANGLIPVYAEIDTEGQLDFDKIETDLNNGLYFNSSIPQGFGVGSSGALVAALYNQYATDQVAADLVMQGDNLANLKIILSKPSFYLI
jgi:hypothetical protein